MKITKNMKLGDVISKHPKTIEIFLKNGLHCVGCHVASFETIEQGAKAHGMSDKNIENMIKELNKKAGGK
ncbi:MAG: DUF1858 domain-containing protein [Nanoarchaeota archaeon]|nr:DUF1858 domain-containing protein [Nanoarchaeota archaeon]